MPPGQLFCDFHTTRLYGNNTPKAQVQFLTDVIDRWVFGNFTPTQSDISVQGEHTGFISQTGEFTPIKQFFDGSLPSTNRNGIPSKINFNDAGGRQTIAAGTLSKFPWSNQFKLFQHLYQYFGKMFDCSAYGTSTELPIYQGNPSMFDAHRFMNLTHETVSYLISQMELSMLSFGIPKDEVQPLISHIDTTFNRRCAPPSNILGSPVLNSLCNGPDCPLAQGARCDLYGEPQTKLTSKPDNSAASKIVLSFIIGILIYRVL